MSANAISCSNITFSYFENGRDILKNTSLDIPEGKITVLMGSSGCGKSTLAAIMCGLLPENGGILKEGNISLFDRDVKELPMNERAKLVSMMFQNPDLQFCMPTLRQELIFCAENLMVERGKMNELAEQAASKMGTEKLLDRMLYTLSGGEKQKAVLTCICLLDSKCIVLDESFANLDPYSVKQLLPMFAKLCHDEGKTIFAIDHMSDHWKGVADRYVIMGSEGQILLQAESQEELENAKPLLDEQGIAYPGIWEKKSRASTDGAEKAIEIKSFSLHENSGEKKFSKKSYDKVSKDSCLYYDADAVIPKGKITAIMGNSGCGKTSFLMTLLKQRKYSGQIILEADKPIELDKLSNKECFKRIGIAFQNPSNQFVTQNVLDEVLDGLRAGYPNENEDRIKERALELLEVCGLRKYSKYSPYMLSQGQQRRLAVLAVLSAGQNILLLDEPTYGQDYKSICSLMELVLKRVNEDNLTVVMNTHDDGLAHAYADVIYHVEDKTFQMEVD